MPDASQNLYFEFFNEVGIIEQLSRNALEQHFPDGVTMAHFVVLNHLIRVGDGSTPLRIAQALQVPKTSLTHTLSVLDKRGLIDMRANPDDGRSKQVWITDAGRTLRETAIARMEPYFKQMAESIPGDRLAAVLPTLSEIRKWLDKARDSSD